VAAGNRLAGPDASPIERSRPLSARSVIASTLLGVDPPRLPSRLLVRSGELFGISDGTTRVALSRMVAAGELTLDDGWYHLAGRLRQRHARQFASRRDEHRPWDGSWTMAVVVADRREAADRAALRDAVRQLKLAELREGVWIRPDNLQPDESGAAMATVDEQCQWFVGAPRDDAVALAATLWDLDGWAADAASLRRDMAGLVGALEAGDTSQLAPAFVVSAAVLRHLLADPRLPDALLPVTWPGSDLRADYDHYDAVFKRVWRDWFAAQHD
jgi:phenylacetic acid degradation operon negative regulatory protein